ncbi:small integral membrane protein 15-like [Penaeus monodon]|uniref:small integral membrane protein 15-like n=1 Tax=Penaeus monodon TaxID=6687 RepID=UPI0018A7A821|nr:small integral membrane protein 15-like [Penaeus monodon]XP_037780758.1 small integral membrane protein 15-like [Penaeus monodon]XP_037780759.1 small integral membrane protein 15-like [Penaeus monodon]XP_037780760.1 small integral membrane protein 15-like [Penaeus monodon]XP_037780761.1 small integral membrane protein 15-like [Penaeus monodon]
MENENPIKTPVEETEGGWLHQLVVYAARNPWEFCWYLLLALSPLFCISAVLSWKLAKALEAQEKEKNRKDKKKANLMKVKRGKAN